MHRFLINRSLSTYCSSNSTSLISPETTVKRLVSERLYEEALLFYKQNVHPFQLNSNTSFIIPSITKACACSQTHQFFGLQIQCNVLKTGLSSESTVSNSLVSMFAKFSDVKNAKKVFDEMPERDTISWNSMINCYNQNGFYLEALELFREMYGSGFVPKPELLAGCISACVKSENWRLGRAIHGLLFVDGRIENSVFVSTALVDFYCRCYDIDTAFLVFQRMDEKNVVSWTAMISGFIECGDYNRGLCCLREMQVEMVHPNRVTLISVLPACVVLGTVRHGKEIHCYAIRRGYDSDSAFSSALVHMYCECGEGTLRFARHVFDMSVKKEIVMWSTIIAGYSQSKNNVREAIRLFGEMRINGIRPNNVTLLAVISACLNLLSVRDGNGIHAYSFKCGFGSEILVQNAFINMYSKCGSLQDSLKVFKEMRDRDCVSWSTLISGFGLHGYAEEALRLFYEMRKSGVNADGMTYLAVLSACNHAGLVNKGKALFDQAFNDVNVSLTSEHCACYIDLLGRAGKIEDACEVVARMPLKPSPKVWSSLVSACKLHGRLDIAESLANWLVRNEPENASNYTLLSMVYAESENWTGVEELRKHMREGNIAKTQSFSKI